MDQLGELFFQGAVVANAFFAFASLCGAEGLGGALSLDETGPTEIGPVEPGRFGFAGTVGLAAGAGGGGEAAWEQWEGDVESEFFCLHLS